MVKSRHSKCGLAKKMLFSSCALSFDSDRKSFGEVIIHRLNFNRTQEFSRLLHLILKKNKMMFCETGYVPVCAKYLLLELREGKLPSARFASETLPQRNTKMLHCKGKRRERKPTSTLSQHFATHCMMNLNSPEFNHWVKILPLAWRADFFTFGHSSGV